MRAPKVRMNGCASTASRNSCHANTNAWWICSTVLHVTRHEGMQHFWCWLIIVLIYRLLMTLIVRYIINNIIYILSVFHKSMKTTKLNNWNLWKKLNFENFIVFFKLYNKRKKCRHFNNEHFHSNNLCSFIFFFRFHFWKFIIWYNFLDHIFSLCSTSSQVLLWLKLNVFFSFNKNCINVHEQKYLILYVISVMTIITRPIFHPWGISIKIFHLRSSALLASRNCRQKIFLVRNLYSFSKTSVPLDTWFYL